MAHIITCAGNGGMVLLNSDQQRDDGLMYRRWGRRSEPHLFGTHGGGHTFVEDLDGIPYDNDYIFDKLAWNFEPSEMGAAFGLRQLDKLNRFIEVRQRHFADYTAFFNEHLDTFTPARQTEGLNTAWLCYPVLVRHGAGFHRSELQEYLDRAGIDSRTIWTGNVTRQPMMRGVDYRAPAGGLPNSDRVMENGLALSCSHGMTDGERKYVTTTIEEFLVARRT
jgi:CDP-6-deoxy-D-xylo-4-hexulose-3-dehydrase